MRKSYGMWIATNQMGNKWWSLEHEGDYDDDSRLFFICLDLNTKQPIIKEVKNESA